MQLHDKEEIEIQGTIAEMRKLNQETAKLAEETKHFMKRNNYFEIIIIIAAFAAGGAFVKFLA